VTPGANSLTLSATETNVAPGFNAQTATRQIQLTLTADAARTLAYMLEMHDAFVARTAPAR